jgi:ribosome biogenesis GTPase
VCGQREDRRVEHVIVANVDQLLIVGSVREPPLSVGFIDRCIIAGQSGGLSPVVCINKSDLAQTPGEYGPVQDLYLQSGLPVVLTSARTGEGIGGLRDLLAGRSTVLAGHSGVGKSSLLNALQPGLRLKIGEMGQWKGTHCTTTVSLLKLDRGGYVVDTPGIREFSLWEIGPGDVAQFFSRIWELGAHCRMSDCTHTHEPHCAVKDALESGRLPALSYDSYVSIVSSIQQDGVPRETGVDRPADQIRKEKRGGSRSTRKQRMMETWREDLGEQPGEEADAQ